MSEELKSLPCPFCGSSNVSPGEQSTADIAGETVVQSVCMDCGACGPGAALDVGEVDYGDVRATAAWNRRAASPSPASDAELPQASAEEVETARLAAAHYGRPESDIPALIAFERHRVEQLKVPGMPGLTGAVSLFVAGFRAASTRTASDTRSAALEEAARLCDAADKSEHPSDLADRIRALAAGEAECDAALRAAPASQHDVEIAKLREAAIALIEEPGLSFGNRVQVVNDFQRHADPKLIVSLIDRLSDTPAVDVEAERKLFEAKFTRPLGIVWTGKDYTPTAYGAWDVNKFWNNWTGWLAKARTQADAGKTDTERLDWLEAHCTGASDSERYLPFRIYWGSKGATKGIRVQIDKARAETTTKPENT